MNPTIAQQFAEDWINAWNGHDVDRILLHYDEAVEFYSPLVQKVLGEPSGMIRGKTALRDYFTKGLAAYPDLHFDLQNVLTGVRSVTLYYRSVNDLLSAEVMVFNEQNQVITVYAHYADRK